jgi:hypothetical protein
MLRIRLIVLLPFEDCFEPYSGCDEASGVWLYYHVEGDWNGIARNENRRVWRTKKCTSPTAVRFGLFLDRLTDGDFINSVSQNSCRLYGALLRNIDVIVPLEFTHAFVAHCWIERNIWGSSND